jgi:hypothetical protein
MPSSQVESALINGHDDHAHSASAGKKPSVAKAKKAPAKSTSDEATRLLQARISQLELDAAGEKDQEMEIGECQNLRKSCVRKREESEEETCRGAIVHGLTIFPPSIEREVKRANRDLVQSISKMDDMSKIDYLTKRSSELLADMRRLEKENQKNKRTRDNLQKERDNNRTELSKTVGLKEKLEKLCRELQRDNNKMKVSSNGGFLGKDWDSCLKSATRMMILTPRLSEREQGASDISKAQYNRLGREIRYSAIEIGRLSGRKGRAEEAGG